MSPFRTSVGEEAFTPFNNKCALWNPSLGDSVALTMTSGPKPDTMTDSLEGIIEHVPGSTVIVVLSSNASAVMSGGGGLGGVGGGLGGGGGLGDGGGGLGGGANRVDTLIVSTCSPYVRRKVSLNPNSAGAHKNNCNVSPFSTAAGEIMFRPLTII